MAKYPHAIPDLFPILGILQIRDVMGDVSRGIVFVHANGEVHRDLKPSNGTYS